MKEIVVDGCTFKYTITCLTHEVSDPTDGSITTQSSTTCKIAGKGIHRNSAEFTATLPIPDSSFGSVGEVVPIPPSPTLTGAFISTSSKVTADTKFVLLKGDKTNEMFATFSDTNTQSGVTVPVLVTVVAEIDDPGQSVVLAN